jgi:hypothetical protein
LVDLVDDWGVIEKEKKRSGLAKQRCVSAQEKKRTLDVMGSQQERM